MSDPVKTDSLVGKKVFARLGYYHSVKPALSFRTTTTESTMDVPAEIIKEGPEPYFVTVKLLVPMEVQGYTIYENGSVFQMRKHEVIFA